MINLDLRLLCNAAVSRLKGKKMKEGIKATTVCSEQRCVGSVRAPRVHWLVARGWLDCATHERTHGAESEVRRETDSRVSLSDTT